MKKVIEYYNDAKVICACGAILRIGSTVKEMRVEICSKCHPLYTGKKKLVDTFGRVERFKRRIEKGKAIKKQTIKKKKK